MIKEQTMFLAADGRAFATRAEAERYEERTEFRAWCQENICCGGEWSWDMVADAVLRAWAMKRRSGP